MTLQVRDFYSQAVDFLFHFQNDRFSEWIEPANPEALSARKWFDFSLIAIATSVGNTDAVRQLLLRGVIITKGYYKDCEKVRHFLIGFQLPCYFPLTGEPLTEMRLFAIARRRDTTSLCGLLESRKFKIDILNDKLRQKAVKVRIDWLEKHARYVVYDADGEINIQATLSMNKKTSLSMDWETFVYGQKDLRLRFELKTLNRFENWTKGDLEFINTGYPCEIFRVARDIAGLPKEIAKIVQQFATVQICDIPLYQGRDSSTK